VASLPARQHRVPPALDGRSKRHRDLILRMVNKGYTITSIADQLAGDDVLKARRIRARIHQIVAIDEEIQQVLGTISRGTLIGGMPEVTEAVMRRGSKGNIPAAKLAMEASGFHNPRMDHHHSGKIEIELKGVPRPAATVDEDHVVDADVVEE
jgi:hypothetical protein